jgi:hypothetical protein
MYMEWKRLNIIGSDSPDARLKTNKRRAELAKSQSFATGITLRLHCPHKT